jgi:hypothetical protein
MWPDPNRKLSNRTLPAVLSWGVLSWGGQDLNLRPTDYEFDPALSPTSEIESRDSLTSDLSPLWRLTLRNVSQSVAAPMRDTSCAGLPHVVNPSCYAFAQQSVSGGTAALYLGRCRLPQVELRRRVRASV